MCPTRHRTGLRRASSCRVRRTPRRGAGPGMLPRNSRSARTHQRTSGARVDAPLRVNGCAVAALPAAQLGELALVRQRAVRPARRRRLRRPVRDVEGLLVGAEDDAVGAPHAFAVLRNDALRAGVEHADRGDREIGAAAAVGREVVDTPPTQSSGSPRNVLASTLRCGSSCTTAGFRPRDTMNSAPFLLRETAPPVFTSRG